MPDAHKNFVYTTVAVAPSPALSGTSLTVATGAGGLFPVAPFNVTVWPANVIPLIGNAEIVRVTNVVGDVLTITRQQEGTAARSITIGDQLALTLTSKTLSDLEAAIEAAGSSTGSALVNPNPTLQGYTQTAAEVITYATISAGSIGTVNVGAAYNVFNANFSGSGTLYYSNLNPTAGTRTRLKITADTSARNIVIPATWSNNRNTSITSLAVPASSTLTTLLEYTGARWEIYGDPIDSTGADAYVKQTSPTMKGSWALDENAGLLFTSGLTVDGKYQGLVEAGIAGQTLIFGDLCYHKFADNKWYKAQANATATSGPVRLGVTVQAALTDAATLMLMRGKIRADSRFPLMTSGQLYVSGSYAGSITGTMPSIEDQVIRAIGHSVTATVLDFNPSVDYMTYKA